MSQAEDLKKIKTLIESKSQRKPIAPIIKVIEQPNYAPMVAKQAGEVGKLAEQAIASIRDLVNNNQAVMTEIANRIVNRPIEFLIQRDGKGDMVKIIPVYEK